MRKLLSIILFTMLAFNWLGLDLVVSWMNVKVHRIAQTSIDEGTYNPKQLIEITVDLELPYTTDWNGFESIKGTLSYQGVVYNFVERKYEKGHMIYHCLPNQRGTELQNARDYFYSLAYDMEKQEKKQDSAPKQLSIKKGTVDITFEELVPFKNMCLEKIALHNPHRTKACLNGFGFIPTQPPEA